MASEPSGLLISAFLLLPLIFGYLFGSIPFGLLLTRAAGAGDIRSIGSGNIGATNVLRTGHKGLAALTLLLDGGKGAAAVILAALLYVHVFARGVGHPLDLLAWSCLAGVAAVVGHVFPVWLKFKGGKGVATALGVALALSPVVGIGALITWLVTAGISRASSIGGMASVIAAPILAYVLRGPLTAIALALIAVLVVWRHHENIRRLIAGTEPKIGRSRR
jgi:glycerol-3-phosphate acyltransferase PlsY